MNQNLKAEMARRDVTQNQLATMVGMDASTLSLKLNGKRDFTLAEARQIRDALGVNMRIDDLFSDEAC